MSDVSSFPQEGPLNFRSPSNNVWARSIHPIHAYKSTSVPAVSPSAAMDQARGIACRWGIAIPSMAPKPRFTAADFETKYGVLARGEYEHCQTVRTLAKALAQRSPPVYVTDGVLKVWFHQFSRPPDAIHVSSQKELVRVCGAYLAWYPMPVGAV